MGNGNNGQASFCANFNRVNRSKDELRETASKGGQESHSGGFASMDPDKQV